MDPDHSVNTVTSNKPIKLVQDPVSVFGDNSDRPKTVKMELSLSKTVNQRYCFIWFEGWSSLIYILNFMEFSHVFIIKHDNAICSHVFESYYTLKFWNLEEVVEWMTFNPNSDPLFIMEGSGVDVNKWLMELRVLVYEDVSIGVILKQRVRSYKVFKGFVWKKLNHHFDCGGATARHYQIGISGKLSWKTLNDEETRWDLKDCLSATVNGTETVAPVSVPYLMQDKNLKQLVKAPSVFSNSGWVYRFLTQAEKLRILDVPKMLDEKILNDTPGDEESSLINSIQSSVPGKVIFRFLKLIGFELTASTSQTLIKNLNTDYKSLISGDFNPVTEQSTDVAISVKADDAAMPVGLWNKEIFEGSMTKLKYDPSVHDQLLESLRELWGMRWFRKRLFSSFCLYMRKKHGMNWMHLLKQARQKHVSKSTRNEYLDLLQDGEKGAEAIRRGVNASWWSWDEGSSLFFWRWPEEAQIDARDGSRFPWKFFPMPAYKKPQRYPNNLKEKELIIDKLSIPIDRGYISPGIVKSLSSFFSVPKGPTDIRLVYDMTKCGLNQCLWAPRFYLPVPDSLFDSIEYDSYMADIDQGEMFLNYFCDPELLPYLGVDVTEAVKKAKNDPANKKIWMRWNRWAMGVCQSPFATTRMYAISLEVIKGNRRDKSNPFAWDKVVLNLPADPDYDPSQPWVSKRTVDDKLPPDCFVFVDDGRVLGRTSKECNEATRRVASVMNHLGEQDAARKRRGCSQRSGAWVGALFRADQQSIGIATSQDKWDKGKRIIEKWSKLVKLGSKVDRKEMEKDRGFLVHLSMVYPSLTPYLKGFHLTLESWRPDRDIQGWKMPVNDWVRIKQHLIDKGELSFEFPIDHTQAPQMVLVAPRLSDDLEALSELMDDGTPPMRVLRSKRLKAMAMSFVDALGKGAGASTLGVKSNISILQSVNLVDRKTSSNFK